MSVRRAQPASPAAIWLALATVYVVWGSTYLGIRVVVEADLPPLLAMGMRFVAAAALMAAVVVATSGRRAPGDASGHERRRSSPVSQAVARLRVRRGELVGTALTGLLLLLGGNGLVAVGEQTVPSGLAALLVATTPLWLVIFRVGVGQRPRAATWAGVLVGFSGVALLGLRGGGISGVEMWGVVVIVVATLSWATGSFLSPRVSMPSDPLVATMYEMAFGGVALLLVGAGSGELTDLHLGSVPAKGWFALAYLVTVGSMVGYSAYVWLLANAPISLVATYAYVNPVVAVLLGWLILSEPVTGVVVLGGALVVLGVALVVGAERPRREEAHEQGGSAPEAAGRQRGAETNDADTRREPVEHA